MAMATYLQMVSSDELAVLEKDPASINKLDQPVCVQTYMASAINYFLTGDAYPSDHPLAPMLNGSRSIDTATLENGAFFVTEPDAAPAIVSALEAVDRDAVTAAINGADFDELVAEEELYELEVFAPDEVAPQIMEDLDRLLAFYKQVAGAGGAVVSYTT